MFIITTILLVLLAEFLIGAVVVCGFIFFNAVMPLIFNGLITAAFLFVLWRMIGGLYRSESSSCYRIINRQ